jgi:rfaE bifunctional protein nucleotidyltransferase chain/domain
MDLDTLIKELETKRDKVIVTASGVFDVLHVGHVRYLQGARALGDILVVAVNSDRSVKENRGPDRPYNSEAHRRELLAALSCVDYVTIFDEKTPTEVLRKIRPNIHVKGEDYTMDQLVERHAVEEGGGKVIILGKRYMSSTELIEKLRSTEDPNP